jgi:hypothetical protein
MAIDTVSDVFAFVAQNAEFTNAVILADTDVPEIRPDERDAIRAAVDHVRESYVRLLNQCREDMYQRANDDPALRATMERNWNRDASIWERGWIDLPLLIEASYVERAYFWIGEVPERKGALSLVGELWVQARRRERLRELGNIERSKQNPPSRVMLTEDDERLRFIGDELRIGAKFADLARPMVDALWPLAVDLRASLQGQSQQLRDAQQLAPGV